MIGIFFVEHRAGVGVGDEQAPGAAVSAARGELSFGARGESLYIAACCVARSVFADRRGVRWTTARRPNLRRDGSMAERDRRQEKQRACKAFRWE
jgi:hypothetical protein